MTIQTTKGVACLGDSSTYNAATRNIPPYPHQLEQLLGVGYSVANFGNSGDTTSQMLTRYAANIQGKGYKYLVFLGGINDIIAGTSPSTILANINTLIADCLADNCQVVLFTVLPPLNYSGFVSGTMLTPLLTLNTDILAITPQTGLYIYDAFTDLQDVVTANQLSYLGGTKPDYKTWIGGTTGNFLDPGPLGSAELAAQALVGITILNFSPLAIPGLQLYIPTSNTANAYVESGQNAVATNIANNGDLIGNVYLPINGHCFFASTNTGRATLESGTRNSEYLINSTQLDLYNSLTALSFLYCAPGTFTIAFFLRLGADSQNTVLFDNRNITGANIGVSFTINPSGTLTFGASISGSSFINATTTHTIHVADGSLPIIIKCSGTGTGTVSFQIGSNAAETFNAGTFNVAGTAAHANFRLGKSTGGNDACNAYISEFFMTNTVVGSTDIAGWKLYNPARTSAQFNMLNSGSFSSPASLTFLYAWFDLSDITTLFKDTAATSPVRTTGDLIALIQTKGGLSGIGRNLLQATSTAQAAFASNIQNGLSVANFTGQYYPGAPTVPNQNYELQNSAATPSGPKSIFVAMRNKAVTSGSNTPGGSHLMGESSTTIAYLVQVSSTVGPGETPNSAVNHTSPSGNNSFISSVANGGQAWNVYDVQNTVNNYTLYVDGIAGTDVTTAGTFFAPDNIGKDFHGQPPSGTAYSWDFNGYLGEVIFTTVPLTSGLAETVRQYLATKWAIPNVS